LACYDCNQRKGSQTAVEFGYPDLQRKAKLPLKDAAAVNATRWAIYRQGLPLEIGTGGRTKYNRIRQDYLKAHWIDAACVGESGATVFIHSHHVPLMIKAVGRGSRQMCRMDRYGFPRTSAKANKRVHGFQTGDMVRAVVTRGKKVGTYIGKVAVQAISISPRPTELYRGFHIASVHVYITRMGINIRKEQGASSPLQAAGFPAPY
jgi:hypothetical protein